MEPPFDLDNLRRLVRAGARPKFLFFWGSPHPLLFGDSAILERILNARTPGEAKTLGRSVSGFSEDEWNTNRLRIVTDGSFAKFSQNADLRDYLLSTGSRVLVEASPRDRIWGIGMAESNPASTNPDAWKGHNLLGFALMAAREELKRSAP